MLVDPRYNSREHRRHAYLTRGIYVDALRNVACLFEPRQLLILKSEDYFSAPDATLGRVLDFLDLPVREPRSFARKNVGAYATIDSPLRTRLVEHFAPHNARLYEFLGVDFGWK